MKIVVAGLGYVGLSVAVLLSQKNNVFAIDVIKEKVELVNKGISPIKDEEIDLFFKTKKLNLKATIDSFEAYNGADYIIVAVQTNYDDNSNSFDTSAVEAVINEVLKYNDRGLIIIKSTVPVGYTKKISEKFNTDRIIFSPEFLREGKALYDNLYPSRIIVGEKSDRAYIFGELLKDGALKKDVKVLYTNSTEAEAIKLFSNTYLALRVAFFNELDTYCEIKDLESSQIIEGVCLDNRIGDFYNNPSFGYGGYCLPKDTKQMKANYSDVPNNIINAIVEANVTRKNHITDMIMKNNPKTIGIYRLIMKANSDNFRYSAIIDIIDNLKKYNVDIIIYEPTYKHKEYQGIPNIKDLDFFLKKSDIIIANRITDDLKDYIFKVYTRDIYTRD